MCVCWLTPSIRPSVRPPAREKGKKKKRTEYRAIIRLRERPVDWPNLRSDHQTLNFSFIIRTPILLFKSFISLSPHMQITTQLCCSSVSFGYRIGTYSDTFICEIHRVSILFRPSGAKWSWFRANSLIALIRWHERRNEKWSTLYTVSSTPTSSLLTVPVYTSSTMTVSAAQHQSVACDTLKVSF